MLERLPAQIDPFRFAETRRLVRGALPLADLTRLVPLLASTDGALTVALEFGVDELGIRFLQGSVSGELELTCQRCLGPMAWPVELELACALVRSEREGERLPVLYEPLLVESVPIALADVIEDELLLSLPLVPMHPEDSCPATSILRGDTTDKDEQEERANPFAVLSSLKRNSD